MAGIRYKEGEFAIIDELEYVNTVYKPYGVCVRSILYNINGPYMLDSQFTALSNINRRIRKRKRPINENIKQECNFIQTLLPKIKNECTGIDIFVKCENKDNNKEARKTCRTIISDVLTSHFSKISLEKIDNLWQNTSQQLKEIVVENKKYIIPPGAKFYCGDVGYVQKIDALFDLILADPPWLNRSAKRTAGYILSDNSFLGLDIRCLSENGLLCIWITNRKGLFEELFNVLKSWNMELVGKWIWLKVTKEGEPVCEFQSGHKVPFETLVISCPLGKKAEWAFLPERYTFVSVPMAAHSRKPPISLLFSVFEKTFDKQLELYARNLWPNCTSIGYEPLLFQNSMAFDYI